MRIRGKSVNARNLSPDAAARAADSQFTMAILHTVPFPPSLVAVTTL